jgi:histidinol-phosphate aminotransferase
VLTQKIGIASCEDRSYYEKINAMIVKTRDSFAASLVAAGWDVLPSKANFVFARKAGKTGKGVYEHIKRSGILVRYFDIPGITDFVRISIGTDEDMTRLLGVMKEL